MTRRAFTVIIAALTLLCSLELLRASFAAYTWGKFTLFDYGVYSNMIWNSGRGDFFRVLLDRSYLQTHLSFTLALLGPLYRLWDHPYLLSLLQWLLLMGGAAVLGLSLRRRGVRGELIAALLFFYTAYPYSQSVVLSEFHGVSLYLLLVPLLYAFLVHRRSLVWIPLLLILGLREDAFLVVLPMLLYFAVRDRWKGGYLYTLLSLAYGALAITVLYPWINKTSLLARRSGEIGFQFGRESLVLRGRALLWLLLPVLAFLRRPWSAVLIFPSAAVVTAMASAFSRQYQLQIHYPAAIMACLAAAMAEAFARGNRDSAGSRSLRPPAAAFSLVAVTIIAHLFIGFLPGGGRSDRIYRRIHPEGLRTLQAARHIPREGTLVVPWQLAGFAANRADLLTWRTYRKKKHTIDVIFSTLQHFTGQKARIGFALLESGEFGVPFFDGSNFILQRGYETSRNEEFMKARILAANTVRLANTYKDAGSDEEVPGVLSVRYWEGSEADPPPLVAHGRARNLAPGAYEARLRLRSAPPPSGSDGGWGSLSLHVPGRDEAIAESEIDREATPPGTFRTQVLNFELTSVTEVEPRIRGGAAPLWLETVVFAPLAGEEPANPEQ